MPIHDLLKLYGYSTGGSPEEEDGDVQEEDSSENTCSSNSKLKVKIHLKTNHLSRVFNNCIKMVNSLCGCQEEEKQDVSDHNEESQSSSDETPSCSVSHSTAQLISSQPSNYLEGTCKNVFIRSRF